MVLNFEQRLLRDDSARVHCLAHSCDRDVGNMTRRAARELANSSTHVIEQHCIVWKLGVFLRLVEGGRKPPSSRAQVQSPSCQRCPAVGEAVAFKREIIELSTNRWRSTPLYSKTAATLWLRAKPLLQAVPIAQRQPLQQSKSS